MKKAARKLKSCLGSGFLLFFSPSQKNTKNNLNSTEAAAATYTLSTLEIYAFSGITGKDLMSQH